MRVLTVEEGAAWCEGRNGRARINTLLVGALPVGAWLLAYQGSAVRELSAAEAKQTDAALDALAAAMAGEVDFSAHFADLVDREPQLPPHLRGDDRQ
jgi:hydrogenase assembly chaperone HypC/HupF